MTSFVSLTVLLFPLSDLPFCLGYYFLLISQELSISYIRVPLKGRNVKFCLAQQFFFKVVFFCHSSDMSYRMLSTVSQWKKVCELMRFLPRNVAQRKICLMCRLKALFQTDKSQKLVSHVSRFWSLWVNELFC